MKKILLITTGLWFVTVLLVVLVTDSAEINDDIYKININRIHERLSSNPEAGQNLIDSLTQEEKGMISSIEVLNIEMIDKNNNKQKEFFHIANPYENPVVYKPITDSSYLVKYNIETSSDTQLRKIVVICSIITVIYLLFAGTLAYVNKYILKPMKRMSAVPKQLAAGYIGKLEVSDKNHFFNEFIWGLDILREQLQQERNRNYELEMERKTLVASLSHDIKTPLSSIKNYAIALKEGIYEEPEEQNKALDVILNKTEVIDSLTKKLLKSSTQAFSIDTLEVKCEEFYMSDIGQRLNQIIQQKTALQHMEYQSAEPRKNLLVNADLDALSQVFDNIVDNAVKYGDLKRIEVSYHREEYYQCITIENTGQPIAENEIKHIFSSYYRGANADEQPGYGLGLYICKKIMKAMEGDIYARNTEKGVKFVIVLRLAE